MADVNHFPPETDKAGSIRLNKSAQPNGEPTKDVYKRQQYD